jgi:hypothetical protein
MVVVPLTTLPVDFVNFISNYQIYMLTEGLSANIKSYYTQI